MSAAAISANLVQKTYFGSSRISGTPKRIVEYYIELTKVTQNDWILLEGAIGDTTKTLVGVSGIVIDSSDDLTQETFTYDDSDDKLVLTAAGVGTCKIFVRMAEA